MTKFLYDSRIDCSLVISTIWSTSPERSAVITLSLPKHVIAAWHPIANEDALQSGLSHYSRQVTNTVAFVQYL